jgi:hypothetical protein
VPAGNVSDCGLSYGTVLHDHLGVEALPLSAKLDGLRVTTDGSELLAIGVIGGARVPLPVHLGGRGVNGMHGKIRHREPLSRPLSAPKGL